MRRLLKTSILTLVLSLALVGRQSTPALASSKTISHSKLNATRTRIMQATEILDDQFTESIARNNYSENQMKSFIHNKLKDSLPQKYQSRVLKISESLISQANLYNMDPLFIVALIENESQFNPQALGRHGEQGLMQVKPSTAKWIAKKYKLAWGKQYSLYHPIQNLKFGVAYLDYLRKKFNGSGQFYIEAYNMGPQRMNAAIKRHIVRKTYQHQIQSHYLVLYEEIEKTCLENRNLERHPRLAKMRAKIKQFFWA